MVGSGLAVKAARRPLRLPLLAGHQRVDPQRSAPFHRSEPVMKLSSPSEQTLREPRQRSGQPPSRRLARIAGIFMVLTFISIPALLLYDPVLNHTDFIAGGGSNGRIYLGALFEILTLIGGVGMAVTLFPVLKRQSESLALGYVTVRVVESCLIAVGIVSLLAVVTLRQDLAGGTSSDNASLILNGRSLVAIHDATFLLGPAFCAAIGNGLILGYLMLRSGLVPRRLAQLGLVGGSLALITALLVLFGAYDQTSGASFILTLPEAVWELSLGIYLIARGFKPSALLYDDGLRPGVDGPLIPPVAAPAVAAA
jgi:Domain of unknown function (DUF4386)